MLVITDKNLETFAELVEPAYGTSTELCAAYKAVHSKVQAQAVVVERSCWIRLTDGRLLQALSAHTNNHRVAVRFGVDSTAGNPTMV